MMKLFTLEKDIQAQFDALVKCVVRTKVKNYKRSQNRRERHEITFSNLLGFDLEGVGELDTYNLDPINCFDVGIAQIQVNDDQLVEALRTLPEKQQAIVLMFYFLEMSDGEIAKSLNIGRNTSLRQRWKSLEKIKEIIQKGEAHEIKNKTPII